LKKNQLCIYLFIFAHRKLQGEVGRRGKEKSLGRQVSPHHIVSLKPRVKNKERGRKGGPFMTKLFSTFGGGREVRRRKRNEEKEEE